MSNLQRQVIHGRSDVGRPKALSAKESILEINEHVDVRLHEFRLDNSNAVELFSEYDLILDGTDNFATRYLVNDAAVIAGKPYVWGSIYRFEGQVSVFWEDAPDGAGLNYRDLYPEAPPPGMVPSCAEGGVLGVLPATVGSIMATRGGQAHHGDRRTASRTPDDLRRTCDDVPDDPAFSVIRPACRSPP